jgi:hypothetical protein
MINRPRRPKRSRSSEANTRYGARVASYTRAILQGIKENTPCTDCGKRYPHYVMEFDHIVKRETKEHCISSMANKSRLFILSELAKCEVVCANCHRTRTYKRLPYHAPAKGEFKDWKRDHIVSPIPRDGKFNVICFVCKKPFWAEARIVHWSVQRQKLFCSLKCGLKYKDRNWIKWNRAGVMRYLKDCVNGYENGMSEKEARNLLNRIQAHVKSSRHMKGVPKKEWAVR